MSFLSKLFDGDKEESPALTKEQKQIEKKLKRLNYLKYDNKKTLSAVQIENPEHDGFYNVSIFVDYSTQEPDVSFDIVW